MERNNNDLHGRVHVSLGGTKNIGNFNSLKWDFGFSVDTEDNSSETLKKEFDRCMDLVVREFNNHVAKVSKNLKSAEEE